MAPVSDADDSPVNVGAPMEVAAPTEVTFWA